MDRQFPFRMAPAAQMPAAAQGMLLQGAGWGYASPLLQAQGLQAVEARSFDQVSALGRLQVMDLQGAAQVSRLPLQSLPGAPVPGKGLISSCMAARCITLADPSMPDCPLVGCTDGFMLLTGYQKHEIIGQNCRFLGRGVQVDPNLLRALCHAIKNGDEFVGLLPNRKKSGAVFLNLLQLQSLHICGKRYVIGMQADVSNTGLNLYDKEQVAKVRQEAARVFSSESIVTWAHLQLLDFQSYLDSLPREPTPPSKQEKPELKQAQDDVAARKTTKNTFLHFEMDDDELEAPAFMRRCTSESQLVLPLDVRDQVEKEEKSRAPKSERAWKEPASSSPHTPRIIAGAGAISTGETPENAKPVMNAGSMGHPDNCTECQFHFFSASGCRMGADCRFCHRFHPRASSKKNRRILKRLERSQVQATIGEGEHNSSDASDEDQPIIKGVRYLKDEFLDMARPPRATLLVGQKVRLAPIFDYGNGKAPAPATHVGLQFSVNPALPDGLQLNHTNGLISGIPLTMAQRDLYTIAVRGPRKFRQQSSPGYPLPAPASTSIIAKCCISLRVSEPKKSGKPEEPGSPTMNHGHSTNRASENPKKAELSLIALDMQAGG
eukprot:TRINITY_DN102466_c0_g1_i1.p1 TRINITY_DN102466_c0_g1~~TRINITY_DN102466_c0_g1_i1.p1  ORF type:complete len:606 (-),score=94.88 TRINITY_DN102466_c0_g1_i1:190-2007(-)